MKGAELSADGGGASWRQQLIPGLQRSHPSRAKSSAQRIRRHRREDSPCSNRGSQKKVIKTRNSDGDERSSWCLREALKRSREEAHAAGERGIEHGRGRRGERTVSDDYFETFTSHKALVCVLYLCLTDGQGQICLRSEVHGCRRARRKSLLVQFDESSVSSVRPATSCNRPPTACLRRAGGLVGEHVKSDECC